MACDKSEIENWFFENYKLTDSDTAKDICDYICFNLSTCGYSVTEFYSKNIRDSLFFRGCLVALNKKR